MPPVERINMTPTRMIVRNQAGNTTFDTNNAYVKTDTVNTCFVTGTSYSSPAPGDWLDLGGCYSTPIFARCEVGPYVPIRRPKGVVCCTYPDGTRLLCAGLLACYKLDCVVYAPTDGVMELHQSLSGRVGWSNYHGCCERVGERFEGNHMSLEPWICVRVERYYNRTDLSPGCYNSYFTGCNIYAGGQQCSTPTALNPLPYYCVTDGPQFNTIHYSMFHAIASHTASCWYSACCGPSGLPLTGVIAMDPILFLAPPYTEVACLNPYWGAGWCFYCDNGYCCPSTGVICTRGYQWSLQQGETDVPGNYGTVAWNKICVRKGDRITFSRHDCLTACDYGRCTVCFGCPVPLFEAGAVVACCPPPGVYRALCLGYVQTFVTLAGEDNDLPLTITNEQNL